jgi:hypothetical protein
VVRNPNTSREGRAFDPATVARVWAKGRIVPNYSPDTWRYDMCGKPMRRSEYGNIYSEHGWEVDHILPVARGGGDELSNLQPLQWQDNRRKGDTYPWHCN